VLLFVAPLQLKALVDPVLPFWSVTCDVLAALGAIVIVWFQTVVIIIDDPMGKRTTLNHTPEVYDPEARLNKLFGLNNQYPLIVATSNEGLLSCLSDRAPGMYDVVRMPRPDRRRVVLRDPRLDSVRRSEFGTRTARSDCFAH